MIYHPTVVLGAGAGGLVVAIGLAKAGKPVLLIEKGPYGGDCTNFGCIPSKTLLASAHFAQHVKTAHKYGISLSFSKFNGDGALQRARDIIQEVRSHEDPKALKKLGIETLTGEASFLDGHQLRVVLEEKKELFVKAKNIILATGSYPIIAPIPGLKNAPYLTNTTIFDLETIPKSLAIIGGGPIGCELGQAFQRLGSQVTLIEHSDILPRAELEAKEILRESLIKDGVHLVNNEEVTHAQYMNNTFKLSTKNRNTQEISQFKSEKLLLAIGRRPNLIPLNLASAGIDSTPKGIITDHYGRTSQNHIYAIGDATGNPFFTHIAENHGRTILRNLLVPWFLRKKIDRLQALPHCTYTDPELAGVGMTEEEAITRYGEHKIAVYKLPFSSLDRAIAAGRTDGLCKIVTKKWSSRILGATIVGERAGEMISELGLAIHQKIPLRKLTSLIHPYPSYNLAIRKCADMWLTQNILPTLKRLLGRD